jgi:hypothetical protein
MEKFDPGYGINISDPQHCPEIYKEIYKIDGEKRRVDIKE